jgi:predicted DNA-binding transcriptional regulator AlpA
MIKRNIYFIKDVERIIGRNRLTLRRWWNNNFFPKPTLINNRLAWSSATIKEWVSNNFKDDYEVFIRSDYD